jgi:ribosomal protein S18 acetylase RimI-like enzyme
MSAIIEMCSSDVGLLGAVLPLYAEVYAEPPYNEGPSDVDVFAGNWEYYVTQPDFRVALARIGTELVGFSFGYALRSNTNWWKVMLDPVDESVVTETDGRTFAIIDLAVRADHRLGGIGSELHTALTRDLSQERVTLLVRPEAKAATAAYRSWGYRPVGRIRPFPQAPVYLAMLRPSVSQ